MGAIKVHQCPCAVCRGEDTEHPDRQLHATINLILRRLNEQQRRWLAALEAQKIGHGGDKLLSEITGLHPDTIRRGHEERAANLEGRPTDRVRKPGGGRPSSKKKCPNSSKP
jgi:hypothetical protein